MWSSSWRNDLCESSWSTRGKPSLEPVESLPCFSKSSLNELAVMVCLSVAVQREWLQTGSTTVTAATSCPSPSPPLLAGDAAALLYAPGEGSRRQTPSHPHGAQQTEHPPATATATAAVAHSAGGSNLPSSCLSSLSLPVSASVCLRASTPLPAICHPRRRQPGGGARSCPAAAAASPSGSRSPPPLDKHPLSVSPRRLAPRWSLPGILSSLPRAAMTDKTDKTCWRKEGLRRPARRPTRDAEGTSRATEEKKKTGSKRRGKENGNTHIHKKRIRSGSKDKRVH